MASSSGSSRGPAYPGTITGFGSREARRTGRLIAAAIAVMVLVAAGILLFALRPAGSRSPGPARPTTTASQPASPGTPGRRPAGSSPAVTASPAASQDGD
jgi:hypothetical protein